VKLVGEFMLLVANSEIKHFPDNHLFAVFEKSHMPETGQLRLDLERLGVALCAVKGICDRGNIVYENPTKREFQDAHKEGPNEHILDIFGWDAHRFRNSRTVGCGTMLYLVLDDGVFQPIVQRTASSQTPEGVVNPGSYTRAAGGAIGNPEVDRVIELNEELGLVIKKEGRGLIAPIFLPPEVTLADEVGQKSLAIKRSIVSEFCKTSEVRFQEVQTTRLNIPGLTQDVVFVNNNNEEVLRDRVVTDNPKNGDMEGLDTIEVVRLHGVRRADIIIYDGEKSYDGKLLNRSWSLFDPIHLHEQEKSGSMKFSPPTQVIRRTEEVLRAIEPFVR
jgi:hypothetical protein